MGVSSVKFSQVELHPWFSVVMSKNILGDERELLGTFQIMSYSMGMLYFRLRKHVHSVSIGFSPSMLLPSTTIMEM